MAFSNSRLGRNNKSASWMSASSRNRTRTRSKARMVEVCEERILMAVVTLGAAKSFAVLGGTTVTNTGLSTIVGDVGVSPGSAITGFPPGIVTGGTIHAGDPIATQAHADLATAYGVLAGETSTVNLTGQDLGGLTLAPGVYHFNTVGRVGRDPHPRRPGEPRRAVRFPDRDHADDRERVGGPRDQRRPGQQRLLPGRQFRDPRARARVRGQYPRATTSITATTGASFVRGRALALNGAVTLDTNIVTVPVDPSPTLTTLNPASIPEGVERVDLERDRRRTLSRARSSSSTARRW